MPNYLEDEGYLTYLDQLEQINEIPTGTLPRMMRAESGGNPKARSPKGATGLFQFMGPTAKEVGINPDDPVEAAGGAAIYLRRLYNQLGTWPKAVAAYNAGIGTIKAGKMPKETRGYLGQVFGETPLPKIGPSPEKAPSILTEYGANVEAAPIGVPSMLGEIAPPKEVPTPPDYMKDFSQALREHGGAPPEPYSLEEIKRIPGVVGRGLMSGLGSAADFFLGGPIISTQQTAPALGMEPLPEIPHDVVTQAATRAGLIPEAYEPRTPREARLTSTAELVGQGVVDPAVVGGLAKGGAALTKHLLEEVGTKAAGGLKAQRGIFGGVGAKTADKAKLAQAQAMEEAGAKREEIWRETGWFKDLDKQWKFEISDTEMKLLKGEGGMRPKSYLAPREAVTKTVQHDPLFAAYPELATTTAEATLGREAADYGGAYYPRGGPGTGPQGIPHIQAYSGSPEAIKSLLAHELQHGVQQEAGFATGGSPSRITDYETYRRLLGEAEARNVQTRMSLTPEQRRAKPPWTTLDVPEGELIVRRGKGVQAAIENPPTRPKEVTPAMRETRAKEQGYLPVTLYHGTVHEPRELARGIEAFDPKRVSKSTDEGWYGRGHYLASDPTLASSYAGFFKGANKALPGATVYPVKARIKKPLIFTKAFGAGLPEHEAIDAAASKALYEDLTALKGWTAKEKRLINTKTAPMNLARVTRDIGPARLTEVLKDNGYDGVIVNQVDPLNPANTHPLHEVVAFDPAQIRSVHADFEPTAIDKPIIGATSRYSKERGAVGTLPTQPPGTPPAPPATPASRQLELSTTIFERNKVRRDIERLSSQTAVLSNSQVRRLGELNNQLSALDTTIEGLGGRGARPALEQLAALNAAPNVREIARRGRQSWAETESRAIALRREALPELERITGARVKNIDSVMRRNIGEAYNAEHVVNAAHHLKTQWADDHAFYKAMADKMDAGTFSEADIVAAHERILGTTNLQSQYSGIAAEAGRALNIFRKTKETTKISQQVHEALSGYQNPNIAKYKTPEAMLKTKIRALAQLGPNDAARGIQSTTKLYKSNWWDKIYEFMYSSMFSGIPTQEANAAGNVGVRLFEDVVRTGVSLVPGSSVTMREAAANLYAWPAGIMDGLTAFSKVMKTEQPWGHYEREGLTRAIKGLKGKIIRMPLRVMSSTDAFFKAMTYSTERRALAMRESIKSGRAPESYLDPQTPEGKLIDNKAMAEAHRRTFTDPAGPILEAIEKTRSSHPLGRLLIPLVHTPGKILKMSLENSPLGFLFKDVRAQLKAGGAERDLMLGRIGLGTGLAYLAYTWVAGDEITGAAPDDPKLRDLFYESGRKPYARKVGNEWIPYKRFEPFATYLGAMADAFNIFKEIPLDAQGQKDYEKVALSLVGGIANNFTDKTFMQSVSNFVDALHDPGRFAENYAANVAGMFIPTISAHIAKANDPYMREANTFMDKLRLKMPLDLGFGKRQDLPRKVSALGEFVREEGTPFERMTSPFIPSAFRDDPLVEELLRLKKGIGVLKRTKRKTVFGKDYSINLDPATYEFMATTRGTVLRKLLGGVTKTPGYQKMTDYERAAMLDTIMKKAKSQIGGALNKGMERDILRLLLEQHPDIMNIKLPGRPPAPP